DVAELFEISQRRIHHARAGRVETAGALLERLDDFVAVGRLIGKQREDQQLQIFAAELPAGAKAVPAELAAADLTEQAPEAGVTAATTGAAALPLPEMAKTMVHQVPPLRYEWQH